MHVTSDSSHPIEVRNEAGQAALMVTLGITFLFGMLGMVVDTGYGYYLKQVAQAAADSGVIAGVAKANEIGGSCGTQVLCQTGTVCAADPATPPITDFDAACLYAKVNGFRSTGNQTVTISAGTGTPPTVSGVKNTNYWLTVTATQTMPLSFLRVLGFTDATISAQATSGLVGNVSGSCIYVLDPTSDGALNMNGSGNIQSNCGVYINSSASDALNETGGATLNSEAVNIVGGARLQGGSTATPTPTTGVSPVGDPLQNLPAPSYGGCDHINLAVGGGVTDLSPGVYCGGIKASAQAVINFSPGNYILEGGGMQVTSAQATLNGSGVFFYNTSSAAYSFGAVDVVSNATVTLNAPTSGVYKGILLFQDRSITSSATTAFGGGSNETYSGAVYLPTGNLQFVGGSSTKSLTVALIAKTLNIAGNAYLQKDTTGQVTGISPNLPVLVQ